MKLICIYNTRLVYYNDNEHIYRFLTIDKIYDIYKVRNIDPTDPKSTQYCIIDDSGLPCWYSKDMFKPLDDYRLEKINEIIN